MQTPDESEPRRTRTGHSAAVAVSAATLIVPVILVGAVFLWPFLLGRETTPYGFDTPHYQWRANLVAAEGLDALEAIEVPLLNPNAERPAYPVFAAMVRAVGGPDPSMLAYLAPAVFAIAIALAAGAFAREVLDDPPWAFGVYATLVGSSLVVVRTAVGSIDNLIVDSVLIAAAAATLIGADRRRGLIAAVLMLVAGSQIHWILSGYMVALLAGVAAILVPDAIARIRRGEPWRSFPVVRIVAVLGASVVAGYLALRLTPGFTTAGPRISRAKIEGKTAERIPELRVYMTMPIAALGAIALWWPNSHIRRLGLALLALWTASLAIALAIYATGHRLPVYRVAEFCLAIPMLLAALVVGLTRLGWTRLRFAGATVGALVMTAAIVLTVVTGSAAWQTSSGLMTPERMQEVASAANYLRAVDATGPVIFVTSTPKFTSSDRVIRAGVPADLITGTRIFVGDGADLLEGHQTVFELDDRSIKPAAKAWEGVQQVIDQGFVAIYLSTFNPRYDPPSGSWEVAPGVYVLRGPVPVEPVLAAAAPGPSPWSLAAGTTLAVLIMFIAGIGWTAGLVEASWLGRAGLAPAMGLGFLTLIGTFAGRFALPLHGVSGASIVIATALGGWIVFGVRRLLEGREDLDEHPHEGPEELPEEA